MRVVVAVEGEVTTRAAQSLSTQPGLEVSLLGGPDTTQFRKVGDASGHDVVVGVDRARDAASRAGIPAVVTGDLSGYEGVSFASIPGLALALAAGLESVSRVAVALPGDSRGNTTVVFPSPIDSRRAETQVVDGRDIQVARDDQPVAAALALGHDRHRVIIDDHPYMEGIALAAGLAVLRPGLSLPVWEDAAAYLRMAADMGLVIGERAA